MLRAYHAAICLLMMMQMAGAAQAGVEQESAELKGAILQTTISTHSSDPAKHSPEKVSPTTEMKLTAMVKNVGDTPSAPGSLFVQFAFPKPLHTKPQSVLFKTERVHLPSIEPGQYHVVNFAAHHQWPSVFDFIRKEWSMREYQAVVDIHGTESITGTRMISFSAYYYEGQGSEFPVRVLSANDTPSRNHSYSISR